MTDREFVLSEYLEEVRAKSAVLANEPLLLERALSGDKEARQAVIVSHLSLAAELGLRLASPELEPLRAIQEANLVLMRVVAAGESPVRVLSARISQHFETLD
jgi:hypothetical protein